MTPVGFVRDAAGVLAVDGQDIAALAEEHGTPLWITSGDAIRAAYADMQAGLAEGLGARPFRLHYAMKANDNQAVLSLLRSLGAGVDVVSVGEVERALAAGFQPGDIVFSGVGKDEGSLARAIELGIHQINVESEGEFRRIARLVTERQRAAVLAFRVNPDVTGDTHAKISTGGAETKFGLDAATVARLYAEAAAHDWLKPVGLAVHIGSQLASFEPFVAAYAALGALARQLLAAGLPLERLDLGGGFSIAYRAGQTPLDMRSFAAGVAEVLGDLPVQFAFEPGRRLVAPAGALISRVTDIKQGGRRFVVLDAAMTELMRPALYEAWHGIVPVASPEGRAMETVDIVGQVCETGDIFAAQREMPALAEGELVALLDAGAYGATMSSTYNARPLAAQLLVDGGRVAVTRARQTLAALIAADSVPDWLQA